MKAYSMDLRERVLAACEGGMGTADVADRFDVSESWVRRLKQRHRERGTVAPIAQRHGRRPTWEACADQIRVAVRESPDLTLREYIERYALPLSKSALARGLAALGLSRKKSRSGRASRTART
jgi:transposase